MNKEVFKDRRRALPSHPNPDVGDQEEEEEKEDRSSRGPYLAVGEEEGPGDVKEVGEDGEEVDAAEEDGVPALGGEGLVQDEEQVEEVNNPPDHKGPSGRADPCGVLLGDFFRCFSEDPCCVEGGLSDHCEKRENVAEL